MKLTIRNLFLIILFCGIFYLSLRPIIDPDFWWHLRTGQLIVQTGMIPKIDPFSYTAAGKQWLTHEWLSEIFIYKSFELGGFGLLILIFSVIITASYIFSYFRCPDGSKPYIAGYAVLLGALTSIPIWGVRPQMLTLLFTSIFLFLLDRFRQNENFKTLIPLPLLTILWVNLHAGYILGIAIEIIYISGYLLETIFQKYQNDKWEIKKPFWILLIFLFLSIIAALLNPAGFHILTYPFLTLTDSAMQAYINEWFSPDFHQTIWQPFAILILVLIGAGMKGKQPISITKVLLTLVFGYGALRSMRNIPLFAIVVIPVLAEKLSDSIQLKINTQKSSKLFRYVALITIIILALILAQSFFQTTINQQSSESENFPKAAVDWMLENKTPGNLLNSYNWGGYLIWRMYPNYRVYIDGRADLYGKEFVTDYMDISFTKLGWENKLDQSNIGIVFVESDSMLANAMRQSSVWKISYEDEVGIIFLRK